LSATPGTCDEVELVSLLGEQIPRYKLRADTLTGFSGYENNDWFIQTPVVDLQSPIDLSPEIIDETLKYFILSADRLSQMTKTYNDIEAVTKLLEEKERDLELAARIGQSLLEQNNDLKVRNEELENELAAANENVIADLEKSETELDTPTVSPRREKSSLLLNWDLMQQRICILESENVALRGEANSRKEDIELEEKKELQLIHDCAKQLSMCLRLLNISGENAWSRTTNDENPENKFLRALLPITDANLQLITLQEEMTRRTDDNIQQQEEITNLLTQVVELQRKLKELFQENESLKNALLVSHECQNELSVELLDLKEKYGTLLAAFHELQDELRSRSKSSFSHWPPNAFMPIPDSLAAELESEGYESELSSLTKLQRRDPDDTRCYSPDSVLSAGSVPRNNRTIFVPMITASTGRQFSIPSKLKIVKPMEGSETLSRWRKLATPHLGVILEQHTGVQGKVQNSFFLPHTIAETKHDFCDNTRSSTEHVDVTTFSAFRQFGNTCSVYTFTTTCLSQSTESTIVTPSFSSVQLSTGHSEPISSVSTCVTYTNFSKSFASSPFSSFSLSKVSPITKS
ncbi:Trafficking kinesin-binding protein 1-like protein, partial [Leptotrombidium deliense]